MKTATIKGVPMAIQRDGWWMDGLQRKPRPEGRPHSRDMRSPLLLLALIALGDALVWNVVPGLSLAVFALALVGAAALLAQSLSPRRACAAGATACLAVAPIVELVQPLSVFLMLLGLTFSLCLIAGIRPAHFVQATHRYPWLAVMTSVQDASNSARRFGQVDLPRVDLRQWVMGWALPLGLGLVFLLLFAGANPLIETFFDGLGRLDLPNIPPSRIVFWLLLALLIQCALVAHRLRAPLTATHPARHTVRQPGLLNPASVTRSLVLFNALFALQTVSDVAFLYGASELPKGMSYATYAHRGAYPLLVTALLAGAFAVLARPFTDDSRILRTLLLVWLAQTLLLVIASATRLEVYVDVYGLTRLRVAAAIWMSVVALGLSLVIWQVFKRHSTLWMLVRCAILGIATLYVTAFIDIDGHIIDYNLKPSVRTDKHYICSLGEGVVPRMYGVTSNGPSEFCAGTYHMPDVSTPRDWREWGLRNWRLRRDLHQRSFH
jgi:hypothetical protein